MRTITKKSAAGLVVMYIIGTVGGGLLIGNHHPLAGGVIAVFGAIGLIYVATSKFAT